jgi:hypothetical protein
MRVFISFAMQDANLATQLEAALRRNNIETICGWMIGGRDANAARDFMEI